MELDYKIIFSLLGILVSIGVSLYYYHSIFRGETKPHVYTWLIFSIILGVTFSIQVQSEGGLGAYVLFFEFVGSFIAFLLSLKYGTKDISRFDTIILFLALVTIVLWLFFNLPVISISLIILIDLLALIPTFRKSYMKPYEETIVVYIASSIIFTFSLLSIDYYSFVNTGYQIAIIVFDSSLVVFLLLRRRILTKI